MKKGIGFFGFQKVEKPIPAIIKEGIKMWCYICLSVGAVIGFVICSLIRTGKDLEVPRNTFCPTCHQFKNH